MNIENIQKAINVMQRVIDRGSNLNMCNFQNPYLGNNEEIAFFQTTEEGIHQCGTSACFAGWLAVSPEWKEFGGDVNEVGAPYIPGKMKDSEQCIREFLGLSGAIVEQLIYPPVSNADYSWVYGKIRARVTAQDVIVALTKIKNGEIK